MLLNPRREFRGRFPIESRSLPWPFAALFGLVGIFGAIKTVWMAPGSSDAFRYLAFAVAAALAVGGVVLLRMALRGMREFNARLEREQNHPHEPWLWSRRPWNPNESPSLEPHGGVFRYGRFPFLFGGEVSGALSLSGPLAAAPRLALNLRHMEEEPVKSIIGGRNAMTVFCDYEHRVEVDGSGGKPLTVQLPLPEEPNLTCDFAPYAKYWVLDVESVPPGQQRASFLVPVYPERSGDRGVAAPSPR